MSHTDYIDNPFSDRWIEHRGYVAYVEQDPSDGVYFGVIKNAKHGTVMFEALTPEEVELHFIEAIGEYEELVHRMEVTNTRTVSRGSVREG